MPSAAILIGGTARRFAGIDKSALLIDGQTILDRQLQALKPLTTDIMLVGGLAAAPGTRAVPDHHSGSGPLAGLEAALEAAVDDPVLLLACDMPFVTTAWLAHLLALASSADVVVPRGDRGYHPLCAVYARRCLPVVRRRLAEGALALKGLLDDLRVRAVGSDDLARFGGEARLLANINTPADLDEIKARLSHEP